MITIRGLKKHYPQAKGYIELLLHPFREKKVTALDGIDLDIEAGQCFFLLGPNGAGKTTLIKVLATLVLPDAGKAFVNNLDVEKHPEKVKSLIGYAINEERSFYWRLTGRQNLEFYAALNDVPRSKMQNKIEEVLSLANLTHAADNRFNTYSTGMKQMLSIARALLSDPKVIFVDEPTKSLDPQAARKIRKFLSEELAGKQKRTIFWTSHDLNEVSEFGHSLAIISKGKIKLKGNLARLTDNRNKSLEDVYVKTLEN
jgi:ABC-2 type transport system ATP-binding protein